MAETIGIFLLALAWLVLLFWTTGHGGNIESTSITMVGMWMSLIYLYASFFHHPVWKTCLYIAAPLGWIMVLFFLGVLKMLILNVLKK